MSVRDVIQLVLGCTVHEILYWNRSLFLLIISVNRSCHSFCNPETLKVNLLKASLNSTEKTSVEVRVAELIKQSDVFCRSRSFIDLCKRVCGWSSPGTTIPVHNLTPISLKSILALPSHVCLGVQSGLNHSHKRNNTAFIKIVYFSKTELL